MAVCDGFIANFLWPVLESRSKSEVRSTEGRKQYVIVGAPGDSGYFGKKCTRLRTVLTMLTTYIGFT